MALGMDAPAATVLAGQIGEDGNRPSRPSPLPRQARELSITLAGVRYLRAIWHDARLKPDVDRRGRRSWSCNAGGNGKAIVGSSSLKDRKISIPWKTGQAFDCDAGVTGMEKVDFRVGSMTLIATNNPEADVKLQEPQGTAIIAGARDLKVVQEQMARKA